MNTQTQIIKWGTNRIAWVQSKNIQSAIDLVNRGEVDGLGISPHHGYDETDISFVADVPGLGGIVLPFARNYDLTVLQAIHGLRFLTIAGSDQPFDCRIYPKLYELRVEWHPTLSLPIAGSRLRSLYIRSYKPKVKNLSDLPVYEKLSELEINQGNITSLDGIEKLIALSSVSLFHLRQLHSIAAIAKTAIRLLHVEGSKTIADVERLSDCPKLQCLRLIDCGKLGSLSFIHHFKKLEELRFVNTKIQDGDMTPLFGLKAVGFLGQKSYSHTPEQVRETINRKRSLGVSPR